MNELNENKLNFLNVRVEPMWALIDVMMIDLM